MVVALDERRRQLPEWQAFASMRAEIQIRTVLQHAWAAVNHQLHYKSEGGLSSEGIRRLNQIAAILENADANFDAIRSGDVLPSGVPQELAQTADAQTSESDIEEKHERTSLT